MKFVFIGLSVSSSWGNGHATTYRGLLNALGQMGHEAVFLEREQPWYLNNRDLTEGEYFKLFFYQSVRELQKQFGQVIAAADMVVLGSYVPEGVAVGNYLVETARGITAFYDIDTPVTLEKLAKDDREYLSPELIPLFDLYLSFSGGKALDILESKYMAKCAVPLYCSVDTHQYFPMEREKKWALGYLGTYSADREQSVNELLMLPCKRLAHKQFVIAGPNHRKHIPVCQNMAFIDHIPPDRHCLFYNQQKFTLNITRTPMKVLGSSPSVRLFEAAACGVPIISDYWEGLNKLFVIGEEILVASSGVEVVAFLEGTGEKERKEIGEMAREKVIKNHTAEKRALELINYYQECHSKSTLPK